MIDYALFIFFGLGLVPGIILGIVMALCQPPPLVLSPSVAYSVFAVGLLFGLLLAFWIAPK